MDRIAFKVDRGTRRPVASVTALALAALLAACGGGGGVAPDTSLTQAEREQAALKRAMELNASALGQRVKGERSLAARSPQ